MGSPRENTSEAFCVEVPVERVGEQPCIAGSGIRKDWASEGGRGKGSLGRDLNISKVKEAYLRVLGLLGVQ